MDKVKKKRRRSNKDFPNPRDFVLFQGFVMELVVRRKCLAVNFD